MKLEEGDVFKIRRGRLLTPWTVTSIKGGSVYAESDGKKDVWDKEGLHENLEITAELVKEEK